MQLVTREGGFTIKREGTELLHQDADRPFLFAGRGDPTIAMYRGNFSITDRLVERAGLTSCALIRSGFNGDGDGEGDGEQGPNFAQFRLSSPGGALSVTVSIREEADGVLRVGFEWDTPACDRFWIRLPATAGEGVYGCGEQFSYFNLRGRNFPLWTQEQGVGRNKATEITFKADTLDRAGGDYHTTFFPLPAFVTSRRILYGLDSSAYMDFRFDRADFHELEVWEAPKTLIIATAPSLRELAATGARLLGNQGKIPAWSTEGVILGIQGGTDTCLHKLDRMERAGVPVSGIWAQDWQGKRITSFGKRLMWNWQWDPVLYPGLDTAIPRLRARGVRFLGYINPYVAVEGNLFAETSHRGYLAKNVGGSDYLVDFGEFDAGIVDFTNPEAAAWYQEVIRTNLIGFGLSGWMADFGEYLPHDVVLHDGTDPMLAHNRWPAEWARINQQAVRIAGKTDEILWFMRAGFSGSPVACPLFWAGDQNVDWSKDDGLASVIPAALSLAATGSGIHHSDTGGYTTLYGMKRTKELLLRWAELSAFTPVMRTHEGNRPDDNVQFDHDDDTITRFGRSVRLHSALSPYLREAVAEYASTGIAVQRPLFFHYEGDAEARDRQDEFLLGRDLLVAPVLEEGATDRRLYLPDDEWVHLWSGRRYGKGEAVVAAPLGEPPAFVRALSPRFAELMAVRDRS